MTDLAAAHRQALDATGAYVAGIQPGQWPAPTPCTEYDVRALLTHIVSGNLWAAELMAGRTIEDVGDALDGDVLGADPTAAYQASAEAAAAAFERPGAMEAPAAVSYGPVPGSMYAGHRFIDVLVHGWDLAVATGQDATLDPELVEACWEVAAPQADMLRGSGMFGESAPAVPHDADLQTRLLALLGRTSAS
jgi:uncharacterized protein (TIGR03086 family)